MHLRATRGSDTTPLPDIAPASPAVTRRVPFEQVAHYFDREGSDIGHAPLDETELLEAPDWATLAAVAADIASTRLHADWMRRHADACEKRGRPCPTCGRFMDRLRGKDSARNTSNEEADS